MKPTRRPNSPCFSTGPCAKRPGWSPAVLAGAIVGRSHRAKVCMARIVEALEGSRRVLGLPDDYRIALVPASDTGAVEMALWSLLGARGVDMLAWESFGRGWATDVVKQLRLEDVRVLEAEYGELPDLARVDPARDVVFTWNGTTSGVRVPDGDWIADDRTGLTICDATSAVFAMDIPWPKIDVATYSWQKVLGGEGQHGILILSPRAVERLESYLPPWPLPKLFRLTKGGKFNDGICRGETINTPSMLCVEDVIDALAWAEGVGGLPALIARSRANFEAIATWVAETPWIEFLAAVPATRSTTSVCLKVVEPWFAALDWEARFAFTRRVTALLEEEGVAYDIASHRDSPPGFRIWGGATVERDDLEALMPWLAWGYGAVKAELASAG